jgi:hypothetical protein
MVKIILRPENVGRDKSNRLVQRIGKCNSGRRITAVITIVGFVIVLSFAINVSLNLRDDMTTSLLTINPGIVTLLLENDCAPGNLTDSCIQQIASKLARIFPERPKSSWCVPPDTNDEHVTSNNQVKRQGVILCKVPKGASSTSASVALRITHRNNCRQAEWQHREGVHFARRDPSKSFLFTTIRDPVARSLSSIFYHIFSKGSIPKINDKRIIRELSGRGKLTAHYGTVSTKGGFTLQYTSLRPIQQGAWTRSNVNVVQNPQQVVDVVQHTVANYDFLLVPDRMDESLVALALTMGLRVENVLALSSKTGG